MPPCFVIGLAVESGSGRVRTCNRVAQAREESVRSPDGTLIAVGRPRPHWRGKDPSSRIEADTFCGGSTIPATRAPSTGAASRATMCPSPTSRRPKGLPDAIRSLRAIGMARGAPAFASAPITISSSADRRRPGAQFPCRDAARGGRPAPRRRSGAGAWLSRAPHRRGSAPGARRLSGHRRGAPEATRGSLCDAAILRCLRALPSKASDVAALHLVDHHARRILDALAIWQSGTGQRRSEPCRSKSHPGEPFGERALSAPCCGLRFRSAAANDPGARSPRGTGNHRPYTEQGFSVGNGFPARAGPALGILSTNSRRIPCCGLPIMCHDLGRPARLRHRATRQEPRQNRLDVEHRCPVDGVQPLDLDREVADAEQAAGAKSQTIGPVFGPLREDPHRGPVRIAAGPSRAKVDRCLRDLVEEEDHLQVRKGFKAPERVCREDRRIKFDARAAGAPVVVYRRPAAAAQKADRREGEGLVRTSFWKSISSMRLPNGSST